MAEAIFNINNPAGRLFQHLNNISKSLHPHSNSLSMATLANKLNITDSWEAISMAISEMNEDYRELKRIVIEEENVNPQKFRLWSITLDGVATSLSSFNCNIGAKTCGFTIDAHSLDNLQYIAVNLVEEKNTDLDDLEKIRVLCDQIRTEVLANEDMEKHLKTWLLDLVRLMQEGIDRYRIRGGKGLRKEFHEMLGAIASHPEYRQKTEKDDPTIWTKILQVYDLMKTASERVEFATKMIGWSILALTYSPDQTN